jgi:hypothetical protein
MALAGLGWLAGTELASVPAGVQADALRDLERAESLLTAARSAVLSAFDRCRGFEEDGARPARSWLRWQTRVSDGAARAAAGWTRRLRGHRLVASALAAGQVSSSWARHICDWTDPLPASRRDDADAIMIQAVADGADLQDLAQIAEELRARTAQPGRDPGHSNPGGSNPGDSSPSDSTPSDSSDASLGDHSTGDHSTGDRG